MAGDGGCCDPAYLGCLSEGWTQQINRCSSINVQLTAWLIPSSYSNGANSQSLEKLFWGTVTLRINTALTLLRVETICPMSAKDKLQRHSKRPFKNMEVASNYPFPR